MGKSKSNMLRKIYQINGRAALLFNGKLYVPNDAVTAVQPGGLAKVFSFATLSEEDIVVHAFSTKRGAWEKWTASIEQPKKRATKGATTAVAA